MAREVEIVVARLKEDIGWTACSKHPVIIYDRSMDVEVDERPLRLSHIETVSIRRDDFGWSASTWLKHIINEYDKLAYYTVFLQGTLGGHGAIASLDKLEIDKTRAFSWLGNQELSTSSDGSPHAFPQIKPVFERLFGRPCPKEFKFKHGYQFWAHRDIIWKKPKIWYQYVLYFFMYYGWETKIQWRSHPERYWDYLVNERTPE